MDLVSRVIVLVNVLYVIIGRTTTLELQLAAANIVDWPGQIEPAKWFGFNEAPHSSAAPPPPGGESSGVQSELGAQRKLAELLGATREKLTQLPSFDRSKSTCAEFNWTLSEAARELQNLIDLSSNDANGARPDVSATSSPTDGPFNQLGEPLRQANAMLHEDADELRKLRALNAYEALGSAVSLYFECLSQLGQLGSVQQLNELLPIATSMGELSGTVDKVSQGGNEMIEYASQLAKEATRLPQGGMRLVKRQAASADDILVRRSGGELESSGSIEVDTNEGRLASEGPLNGGLVETLGKSASDLFEKSKAFF